MSSVPMFLRSTGENIHSLKVINRNKLGFLSVNDAAVEATVEFCQSIKPQNETYEVFLQTNIHAMQ